MLAHINVTKLFPAAYKAVMAVEEATKDAADVAGIDPLTVDLVKLRASQINGCAFCLRMHTQDALANGETTERLALVAAWWESQYFTPVEQAALTIAEQITRIGDLHTLPAPTVDVESILDEKQIAALTWVAITINTWNRVAISSHYPVAP
ncbi:AhpD family alkylhydroperoxidase [Nocardioides luteus]|uniref:Alkyl hydroperoxide reductase AhpD n=1 Tax=Nocardioides luteus TaxID=1844 RepID=A0ABQ5SYY6_9ACTN|nr:carboxymuconolactone decarboxylase family protein [Nocardioides luteus]MDR7312813.1 AhpD family alkylhydroperoxidase [Nocardioides luteus]GGR47725.1 alkyl hydroperoxide reductase AhpD [Nocardioides luteus]GLJ69066.1 alkyl hydroperoxide reductase AhpD [Nocardioides luteus]